MASRFTRKAQKVLNLSMQIASELGHTYIGSEHLLLGLLSEDTGVAAHYLQERGATVEKVQEAVVRIAGEGTPSAISSSDITPRTKNIIENSLVESQRYGQNYIGTEHLLLALLEERDCVAVRVLETLGVSVNDLRQDIVAFLNNAGSGETEFSGSRGGFGGAPAGRQQAGKDSLDSTPTLKNFGRDLTAMARAGKIDPIIGRDSETERVIQILSRRTKINPCLIGETGVGKSAVVE